MNRPRPFSTTLSAMPITRTPCRISTLLIACSLAAAPVALSGCEGLGGATADTNSILGAFSGPTPTEAAAWAVDPYDADKRARGMLILANQPFGGERVYIDVYRLALNDEDPAVRAVAVRALALHGTTEDAERIAEHLDDGDRLLRWESARGLQRLHNTATIDPLLERLDTEKESQPEVRAAAARALGQYAEAVVLEGLISALDDRDLTVNRAAKWSLKTLTGQDFRYDVREWVAWRQAATDPFAERRDYEYPVFSRSPTWVEKIIPWMEPPNEERARPVGMPVQSTDAG